MADRPPKDNVFRAYLRLTGRQRIGVGIGLMCTSLLGLWITDRVEQQLLQQQAQEQEAMVMAGGRDEGVGLSEADRDLLARNLVTRGTSTDRVRLEERARKE
ncbi:hypothetical protein PYCC9005_002848 [Savitreella phatthalungensis]